MLNYEGTKLGSYEDPTARRRGVKLDRWARQVSIGMKAIIGGNKPAAKVTTGGGGSQQNPGTSGNLPDHDHHASGFGGNVLGIVNGTIQAIGTWAFAGLAIFNAGWRMPAGAGVKKVAVSDGAGNASWAALDASYLADRVRRVSFAPEDLNQSNGTSMPLNSQGLYPTQMYAYQFIDAPASGPQAIYCEWVIPKDWVSGLTAYIVWGVSNVAPFSDLTFVANAKYKILNPLTPELYDAAATTVRKVLTYSGASNTGIPANGDVNNRREVVIAPIGDISTGAAVDRVLRLHLERDSTDGSDNANTPLNFYGLILEYTADS